MNLSSHSFQFKNHSCANKLNISKKGGGKKKMGKNAWKYNSFTDILRVPITFYKSIGEEIYEHRSTNRTVTLLFKILFYAGLFNFNVLVTGEVIYFLKALQNFDTILEATAVAPCIGFSLVADFKQGALAANKKILRQHLDELEEIFPASRDKQLAYKLPRYAAKVKLVMNIFSLICLAYTSTFSIYPICKSFVQYYLLNEPVFERNFGFFIWYPYNATQNRFVYGVTYMSQVSGKIEELGHFPFSNEYSNFTFLIVPRWCFLLCQMHSSYFRKDSNQSE